MRLKHMLFIFFLFIKGLNATPIGDNHLSVKEAELVKLINDYRQQYGKSRLPASKSLTYVGRWHAWDASNNNAISGSCNLHSWSNAKPAIWDGMCYTGDHAQARQMWYKPSQITNGVFKGHGYENSAQALPHISANQAFNMWKGSPGHRMVMLEQGMFADIKIRSIGVGIDKGYAFAWFSSEDDPQGNFSTSPTPIEQLLFSDSFED